MRPVHTIVGITAAVSLGIACQGAPGQDPGVAPEVGSRARAAGLEVEIREADDAFVRDFDRGDARALAGRFTEDAEIHEADGARYRGRAVIERSYDETFLAQPGAKLSIQIDSVTPLSDDVAKEEGRSTTTLKSGAVDHRLYTALLVKREGRWLLASLREEADPLTRPGDRLRELGWMVGDWIDSGPESETRVSCRWSPDGAFLLRDFVVRQRGKAVLQVGQRVGWDPVAKVFRSWEFDSEGGFGEGRWSREGDRWVVNETGVRPEGTTASSTRTLVRVRDDQVRWTLTDRVVGGSAVAGEASSTLTRVPPAPGVAPNGSNDGRGSR